MDCYFITKEGKLGEGKYVSGGHNCYLSVVELTHRRHERLGESWSSYNEYEYNLIDRFTGEILATITSKERISSDNEESEYKNILSINDKFTNLDKIISDVILDTQINEEFRNVAHEYFQSLIRQSMKELIIKRSENR